jgi:hypothetical protein
MTVGRRPKRHNPNAERLTFTCELECCPQCGDRLSAEGCSAHSNKTVQTLAGDFYVVAYSRVCANPECDEYGTHFHAGGHLRVSPPYSTYGLDVIAFVGIKREREHKQFTEIRALLNEQGVEINDASVGRLYRLFLALVEGTWPHRRQRIAAAAEQHGGLILMADGLSPDGDGPQLYVLWEVFSGTPISGMLIDQADETHLTDWLNGCLALIDGLPVLALLSDKEKALVSALRNVWATAPHQLCQMHFMNNLSGPVHRADQSLRGALRDQLSLLPAVPELEPEEVAARIEQLVPGQDTVGGKRPPGRSPGRDRGPRVTL